MAVTLRCLEGAEAVGAQDIALPGPEFGRRDVDVENVPRQVRARVVGRRVRLRPRKALGRIGEVFESLVRMGATLGAGGGRRDNACRSGHTSFQNTCSSEDSPRLCRPFGPSISVARGMIGLLPTPGLSPE